MKIRHDLADDRERVRVVVGEVIGDARNARVHVAAAELFGGHLLAGRRLHKRRSAEKDRSVALDDHRFVAHGRNVRAAGGARAHDCRDLRNALTRHARLIVENPSEVLAVGEHVGLQRQERAAGIDQVNARQMILLGDLLRAQMLLDGHRIVRAALDRRVVGDDDAVLPFHDADPGDHSGRRRSGRRTCRWPPAPRTRENPTRRRSRVRCARARSACCVCDVSRSPRRRRLRERQPGARATPRPCLPCARR